MERMDVDNDQVEGALLEGVSVIVPVYNGSATIEELVARIGDVLTTIAPKFEVILVNDGSRDKSWNVICELSAKHDWVTGVNLMRNCGQHNALLCGLRMACYDVSITMDDDLQHPPEEIPKLMEKLDEDYDVVYGTPMHEQHGALRDMASKLTKLALQSAMGAETARNVCAFRLFRTQLREAFADYKSSFVCLDILLTWATNRFATRPVNHEARSVGKSNYTLRKLVTVAVNLITGYSTIPLQIASILGFALTAFGVGILIYVVVMRFASGAHTPGFAFLAILISIYSGTQLFCIGIMGEYLARVFSNSMGRPSYMIRLVSGRQGGTGRHTRV